MFRVCVLLIVAAALLQLTACAPPPQAPKPRREHQVTTTIQTQPAAEEPAPAPTTQPSGTFLLRAALLPPLEPQPYRIHLHERRELESPGRPNAFDEIDIIITGTLRPAESPKRDALRATLTLEQIRMEFGGQPDSAAPVSYRYDSATDRPGRGNPFADQLSRAVGAELLLRVSSAGRLREASGLDAIWRKSGTLAQPPWQFMDMGLTELLSEALFPPMPGSPIQVGDRFEIEVPADLPNTARLNAHLRGRFVDAQPGPDELPVAHLELTGEVLPARDVLRAAPASVRPTVRSSSLAVTQHVDWNARALTQAGRREMELEIKLRSAAGGEGRPAILRQTRTLEAVRGKIAPVALPATQP